MRSQNRCSSGDERIAAQEALDVHGCDDVFCADTRRTLVVIHADVYAERVDYIVYRVDLAARRTPRPCDTDLCGVRIGGVRIV
jgi:hypothetical protein